jgi:hypothetical protein
MNNLVCCLCLLLFSSCAADVLVTQASAAKEKQQEQEQAQKTAEQLADQLKQAAKTQTAHAGEDEDGGSKQPQ